MRGVREESGGVVEEEVVLRKEGGGPEEGEVRGVARCEEVDVWVRC